MDLSHIHGSVSYLTLKRRGRKRLLLSPVFFVHPSDCMLLKWRWTVRLVCVYVWVYGVKEMSFYTETVWAEECRLCPLWLSLCVPIGFKLSSHSLHLSFPVLHPPQIITDHTHPLPSPRTPPHSQLSSFSFIQLSVLNKYLQLFFCLLTSSPHTHMSSGHF